MNGARTRSLVVGSTRFLRVAERGHWLQVIDGGEFSFRNKLTVHGPRDDSAFSGEQDIPCIGGSVVVADFEEITLEVAFDVGDTVVVRVGTGPLPEPPVTGKPRVKWLSIGENLIEGVGAAFLLDHNAFLRDDGDTRERHEFLELYGWVVGDQPFGVYACTEVGWSAQDLIIAQYDMRTIAAPAGHANLRTTTVCQFFDQTTTRGPMPARWPANLRNIQAVNSNAAVTVNLNWMIGVRG